MSNTDETHVPSASQVDGVLSKKYPAPALSASVFPLYRRVRCSCEVLSLESKTSRGKEGGLGRRSDWETGAYR